MDEKPTTANKIIASCLIVAFILVLATFYYVLESNSGMAAAMATVMATTMMAWPTMNMVMATMMSWRTCMAMMMRLTGSSMCCQART